MKYFGNVQPVNVEKPSFYDGRTYREALRPYFKITDLRSTNKYGRKNDKK